MFKKNKRTKSKTNTFVSHQKNIIFILFVKQTGT